MKLLFDFLPILLFFVAYKVADIYVATGVAIVATVLQIAWLKVTGKPVESSQWLSLGLITVFGGMTIWLQDETFIKWKPTVLYGSFAIALVGARLLAGRNLIKLLMGRQLTLPEPVWDRVNIAWAVFFAAMAALNLYVANRFSTETWVNFKLFGSIGLTIAFVIAQALYLGRYVEEQK